VLDESNKSVFLSIRNLEKVKIINASELNTYEILWANKMIITENSLNQIDDVLLNKTGISGSTVNTPITINPMIMVLFSLRNMSLRYVTNSKQTRSGRKTRSLWYAYMPNPKRNAERSNMDFFRSPMRKQVTAQMFSVTPVFASNAILEN